MNMKTKMRDKLYNILFIVIPIIVIGGLILLGCWLAKTIWNSNLPDWLKVVLIAN